MVYPLFPPGGGAEYIFACRSCCLSHAGARGAGGAGDYFVPDRHGNLAGEFEAGRGSSAGAGNYFMDAGGGGVADVDPGGVDCDLIAELNSKLSLSSHCAG